MAWEKHAMNSDGSMSVQEYATRPPQAPAWGADHCLSEAEWAKFRDHLAGMTSDRTSIVLSIAEVERIIGRRLPAEAGLPQWWSQCPGLGRCGRGTAWYVTGMPGHYLLELARC